MTFINVALRNHPEQHREQPEQQKKGNHILTVIAAYPNPIENIVLKPSKWTGNAAIQSLDFGHKKKTNADKSRTNDCPQPCGQHANPRRYMVLNVLVSTTFKMSPLLDSIAHPHGILFVTIKIFIREA